MPKMLVQLIPIILMFLIFSVMVFIPDKKKRKQYNDMLTNLKVNDEVMTKGGIIGRLISIDDESVILESGPSRARIKIHKNGIGNVLSSREEKSETPMAKEVKEEK